MPSSCPQAQDLDYVPCFNKDQDLETPKDQKINTPQPFQGSSVRRSSRANKGVPRPIFDPSDWSAERERNRTLESKEEEKLTDHYSSSSEEDEQSNNKKKKQTEDDSSDYKNLSSSSNSEVDRSSGEDDLPLTNLQTPTEASDCELEARLRPDEVLSCICRSTKRNRLLVLCYKCDNWLHAVCVGVSSTTAQQLNPQTSVFICPNCLQGSREMPKNANTEEVSEMKLEGAVVTVSSNLLDENTKKEANLRNRLKFFKIPKKKSLKRSAAPLTTPATQPKKRKCAVDTCPNDALDETVYCSNACILAHARQSASLLKKPSSEIIKPKYLSKPDIKISSESNSNKKKFIKSLSSSHTDQSQRAFTYNHYKSDLMKQKTISPNEDSKFIKYDKIQKKMSPADNRGKTASFFEIVRKHEVKQKQASEKASKKTLDKPLTSTKPMKIEARSSRPSFEEQLAPATSQSLKLKSNKIKKNRDVGRSSHREVEERHKPEIRIKSTTKHDLTRSKKSMKDVEVKRPEAPRKPQKSPAFEDIRTSVRRSILNILKTRSETSEEPKMHPDSISRLANKIEESLHKTFGDTNSKYKTKYRSIMFNLKDPKNHGLWRKVIMGEVTTGELVQMTPEQMASKKLSDWRQQNLVQELDIITKQEKERATFRPVAKITHKGEIAIQEDLSDMVQTRAPTKIAPSVVCEKEKEEQEEGADPTKEEAADTTLQHNEHLFDLNCKICTGNVKAEDVILPECNLKTVKSYSSIVLSAEAQQVKSLKKEDQVIEDVEVEKSIKNIDEDIVATSDQSPMKDTDVIESPQRPESPSVNDHFYQSILGEDKEEKSSKLHPLWCGDISMCELPTYKANLYPVHGDCEGLGSDLPASLELGGRINPNVAWKYLKDIKNSRTKTISIIRFHAVSGKDSAAYVTMLSYFSRRNRFGVLGNPDRHKVKDMYLIPLLQSQPIPDELQDLTDDGINECLKQRTHSVLVGIVVRQKLKSHKTPEVVTRKLLPGSKSVDVFNPQTVKSILEHVKKIDPAFVTITETKLKVENDTKEEVDFAANNEDNLPYDPEEDQERITNKTSTDLYKKEAILKIQHEMNEKSARLAAVEQSLQQSIHNNLETNQLVAATSSIVNQPTNQSSVDPLQTILTALKLPETNKLSNIYQPSPPQLPDSTTKSDSEENLVELKPPDVLQPETNNHHQKVLENTRSENYNRRDYHDGYHGNRHHHKRDRSRSPDYSRRSDYRRRRDDDHKKSCRRF